MMLVVLIFGVSLQMMETESDEHLVNPPKIPLIQEPSNIGNKSLVNSNKVNFSLNIDNQNFKPTFYKLEMLAKIPKSSRACLSRYKFIYEKVMKKIVEQKFNKSKNELQEDSRVTWEGYPISDYVKANIGNREVMFDLIQKILKHLHFLLENNIIIDNFNVNAIHMTELGENSHMIVAPIDDYSKLSIKSFDHFVLYNKQMEQILEFASELFPEIIIKNEMSLQENEPSESGREIYIKDQAQGFRILLSEEQQQKYVSKSKGRFEGIGEIFYILKNILKESKEQSRINEKFFKIEIKKLYRSRGNSREIIDVLILSENIVKKEPEVVKKDKRGKQLSKSERKVSRFDCIMNIFRRKIKKIEPEIN